MAMDQTGAALAALIDAEMVIEGLTVTADPTAVKTKKALARAIVKYMVTNGQVTSVTTCPAGAGTGTGSIA